MKESRDILTLFEALSNHEVFTPPRVARSMLELLPDEIWTDPSIRILDPCTKSGVFLREAFFLLFTRLPNTRDHVGHDSQIYDLSDPQQRINHILKNMLYGIAISELTSYMSRRTLYGVMKANTDKQIASLDSFEQSSNFEDWDDEAKDDFIGRNAFNEYYDHNLFCVPEYEGFEEEGNIFYPVDEVGRKVVEDGSYEIEDTYYPFILDETQHQKIKDIRSGKVKFDVIVGNPPYQLRDQGETTGASPIYHRFIEMAKSLSPSYINMIIPSRWFAGGKGLNSFRETMLTDNRISTLVDFTDARDCFPGVDIAGGVCYFLWDKTHRGDCEVVSHHHGSTHVMTRALDEFSTFVRYNEGVKVLRKIQQKELPSFAEQVSSRKPFGLATNVRPIKKGDVKLIFNAGEGLYDSKLLTAGHEMINKWKVATSKVSYDHGGQPDRNGQRRVLSKVFILGPGEVCTETYIIAGVFDNRQQAENCITFLKTKFVRFLISLMSFSQDITKERFRFVPTVSFASSWSDAKLNKMFNLDDQEIQCIDSLIRDYE